MGAMLCQHSMLRGLEGWRQGAAPRKLLGLTRAKLPRLHLATPTLDQAGLAARLQADLKYIIEVNCSLKLSVNIIEVNFLL